MTDAAQATSDSQGGHTGAHVRSGLPWALIAVSFWGTSSLVIVLVREVPTGALLFATHAIGAATLSAIAWVSGARAQAVQRGIAPSFVGIALLGTLVYQTCYVTGLRLAPPGEANLLNYLWPMFTAAFAISLRGERLSPRVGLAMLSGLAGAGVLVADTPGAEFPYRYVGYGLALCGAVSWGVYSNLIARLPGSPLSHQRAILTIGAIAFLPMLAIEGVGAVTWPSAAGIAFLGAGSVGLAAVCWQSAMVRGPVRVVAAAAYVTPLLSTLMLVAFAGQPADWRLAGGLILVLLAAILSSRA